MIHHLEMTEPNQAHANVEQSELVEVAWIDSEGPTITCKFESQLWQRFTML